MEVATRRETNVRKWYRAAVGLVRLTRPLNVAMFIAGTALGGLLSAGWSAFGGERGFRLLAAALSAALIGAAANALNDVFDLEIDRINRPGRPLPSGIVSPGAAKVLWALASSVALALGFWLSVAHAVIAAISIVLCFLYSTTFKRMPLVGNLVVAFVTPLALLVYGGWAVGPPGPALMGAVFAFLLTLAREITKDIEDAVGDSSVGARTYPLVAGPARAARLTSGIVILTIVLTPLPVAVFDYGTIYLVIVLVADAILLRVLWLLHAAPGEIHAGLASRLLKGAMIVGIAALAAAGLST